MNKVLKGFLIFYFSIVVAQLYGQVPQWQWAQSDTNILGAPGARHPIIAVGNSTVLWAVLRNNKITLNEANGDYLLTEFDTAGAMLNSSVITGRLHLIYADADAVGNWYVLGQYFDTLHFANGFDATRSSSSFSPDHFIARFDAGTLSLNWFKLIGGDNSCSATTFHVKNNKLYLPIDSADFETKICALDLQTGNSSLLWVQGRGSRTSSIQADSHGNIYLAGSCAFSGLDFNGHLETQSAGYPAYIVRYKANGQYDWSYWMHDVTCVERKFTLASDNSIYYSGAIHDTLSLGNHQLHHPAWVYDFMVSSFDSAGNINWIRQQQDTLAGDGELANQYHAAAGSDGSIYIAFNNRGYVNWGNNVISNTSTNDAASVLNIGQNGVANWVKSAQASTTLTEQLAGSNGSIWLTGLGYDSTALMFDNISLPAAWQKATPYIAKLGAGSPAEIGLLSAGEGITIAPNPAHKYIVLQGLQNLEGEISVSIKDLMGRYIINYKTRNKNNQQIDISDLHPGIYFVEVGTNGFRKVEKMFFQ